MKDLIAIVLFIAAIALSAGCGKDKRLAVGDAYQGGVIVYIDKSGEHGLIAATTDQSAGISWSNGIDTVRTAATGEDIGTGESNTKAITEVLGAGNYAAKLCEDLVIDEYDDWFLPSSDELNLLYGNKNKIGGFADAYYWSSTDLLGLTNPFYAMNQHFSNGSTKFNGSMTKPSLNRVRAVRSF